MVNEKRIEKEERVQVNLTISREALNMMDELAKHNLRSRSNMFEVLLRQFYKEQKAEQKKKELLMDASRWQGQVVQ